MKIFLNTSNINKPTIEITKKKRGIGIRNHLHMKLKRHLPRPRTTFTLHDLGNNNELIDNPNIMGHFKMEKSARKFAEENNMQIIAWV